MNKFYITRIILCVLLFLSANKKSFSQSSSEFWSEIEDKKSVTIGERSSIPLVYRAFQLDLPSMISLLNTAVDENLPDAFRNGPVVSLPMPDGSFSRFQAAYTTVMPKELADKFPMIRTFTAKGIDDSLAIARLDYTQWGFHAMIMSPNGWVFIDPASIGNTAQYICYDRRNTVAAHTFICETLGDDASQRTIQPPGVIDLYRSSGTVLRTYRLAVACTGEYAAFYGGTVSGAMSGIVTSVNRVTQVYEVEVSIRLVLIPNENLLIYTNSATDPYTNGNGSTMLGENQSNITTVIGTANYDIGHVFSTGGGGVAGLGVVCSSSNKARGVTGQSAPVGDNFDIDYVAHEMGHQHGGNHTFNSGSGNCTSNRSGSNAYETGSGTTIMAYAGICAPDDIMPHSDAIFHTRSFDEIVIYTTTGTGSTCGTTVSTGNAAPVVTLPAGKTIPYLTAFTLTGSGTDANGDPLTYLWEQYDLGAQGSPNSPVGNAPIFRDFVPTTSPSRTFPRIEDLVRNTQTLGEILPTYARTLHFRFTARDNRLNGGGVQHDDNTVAVTVTNTADTFKVTSPNTAVTWTANSTNTVTWKVASTTAAPISCANVNILLSVDSGYTFPYILISNTPNDGSEVVTLPNVVSNKARIKVEAAGNIFFDISDVNFSIITSSGTLTTITTQPIASSTYCAGASLTVNFTIDAPANAGNIFKAQLSNAAGSFANPDSIGSLSSVNAGPISVVIPANTPAGTAYRIRVVSTNPIVTGTDNGTNIIISSIVNPGVSISANPGNNICSGSSVTFTAVPVSGGAAPVYQWKNGAVNVGTNSPSFITSALNNGNIITCTMTSNAGCVSVNPVVSNAITMNVTTSVTASISITVNPGSTICAGTSVTFIAAPVNGGAAPGFQWKNGTTNVGTNSIAYTVSSLTNGNNISCIMTSNAACVNGSPDTSNVISMTVSPIVTASVNISANPGNTICAGTSVAFTAVPANGGASPVYQWKNGAANVGTNSSTFSTSALTNGNNISCIMTSNASCAAGSPDTSNVITMSVNPIVNASVSITANPGSTICSGTSVTFTAVPSNGGASPVYQWKNGAVNVGTNNSSYSTSTLSNGNVITCEMTSNAACVTGNPAVSNAVTMTVNPNVTASISISANPGAVVCSGSSAAFTAVAVNGGASPSYQWKNGTANVGTNNAVFNTSTLSTGDIITCVVTSNAACVSGSPASSNPITMTVNPNVTASITISSNQGTSICSGSPVSFTAVPLNQGVSPQYQWKRNAANVGTNSMNYTTASLLNGDVITCILTSNAICVTGSPAVSNPAAMTVNPILQAGVSITANPGNNICSGTSVTFTAVPSNGGNNPTYQWKKGSTIVSSGSPVYAASGLSNGDIISCVMFSNASCVNGSPATSNPISIVVNSAPVLNSFSPAGGNIGSLVTLTGSGFTGASSVAFNGVSSSFIVDNNNQITAIVPVGASSGLISITSACGSVLSVSNYTVANSLNLNLRIFIEGFYIGGGQMNGALSPLLCDTVAAELAEASFPYSIVYSVKNVININGYGTFAFPLSFSGGTYYIVVKHRNALQTWSASPVTLSAFNVSYDFTVSASQAYGNNMVNVGPQFFEPPVWAFYSGDISDAALGAGFQDELIESQDYSDMENAVSVTLQGYFVQDITGDNLVESQDYSIMQNNISGILFSIHP